MGLIGIMIQSIIPKFDECENAFDFCKFHVELILADVEKQTDVLNKQVKLGLDKNHVACSDDLVLMEKLSGLSVACIKRTTVEHLEFRGWKIISQ